MRCLYAAAAAALITFGVGSVWAEAHGPQNTRLIESYYHRYLGRPADCNGMQTWTERLRCAGPDAVQAGILASEEYYCRNGHTAEGFVAGLYRDVLGRPACGAEIQTWVGRLCHGGARETVAAEFLPAARAELASRPVHPTPGMRVQLHHGPGR
jgi:hypothetical protein